ncbi:hypothetical protein WKW80_29655 [Variovorax humicola]|uniref:Uncharacterized protein n=1 Tax=Variovorax humicola TaxID=1769758 RepID=A0ABU8W9E9_9BURK
MSDLSKLDPVAFDQGKGQWVEGVMTGIDRDNPVRTHTVGIPHLMPGTIIFVHGVTSDGEWYSERGGGLGRLGEGGEYGSPRRHIRQGGRDHAEGQGRVQLHPRPKGRVHPPAGATAQVRR